MDDETTAGWGCGGLLVLGLFIGAVSWLWEHVPLLLALLPVAGVLAMVAGIGYAASQSRNRARRDAMVPTVPWKRGQPCPLCRAPEEPSVQADTYRLRVQCGACGGTWWAPLAYLHDELE